MYIPTVLFGTVLFPTVAGGIWLPAIAAMPAATVFRDRYFGGKGMLRNLLLTVGVVSLVMLLTGAVRELLGSGMLSGRTLLHHPPLPILDAPAGGLLLLCCLCIARVYLPVRLGKGADDSAAC